MVFVCVEHMGGVLSFVKQTVPNNIPQKKRDFNQLVKNPHDMPPPAKAYVTFLNSVINFPTKGGLFAYLTVCTGNMMYMKYMTMGNPYQNKGSCFKKPVPKKSKE